MKKTFPLIMLPAKGASRLMYPTDLDLDYGKLIYHDEALCVEGVHPQHLYILSDDKIEDGDWCIDVNSNQIFQCIKNKIDGIYDKENWVRLHKNCKKVIVTTDNTFKQVIIQIPDSFLPVYVKANNDGKLITEVDLEIEEKYSFQFELGKKKIIIKTRPDNTVILHQSRKYSREELENFIRLFNNDKPGAFDCTKWISENL